MTGIILVNVRGEGKIGRKVSKSTCHTNWSQCLSSLVSHLVGGCPVSHTSQLLFDVFEYITDPVNI